ncbi:hypothetical protein L9F63_020420, partial [Diploptera punctata]
LIENIIRYVHVFTLNTRPSIRKLTKYDPKVFELISCRKYPISRFCINTAFKEIRQ